MTGNSCLLDTSIIIHSFRNNEYAKQALSKFDQLYVNSVVCGELYYGAYFSTNPQKHIKQIEAFLINCSIIHVTAETSVIYGQVKSELRKKGTPIPENDIWIAASAIEHGIPLFTNDNHFKLMQLNLILL
jgi:tRNA(fMet)-specific endonuclease VapC